MLAFLKKRRDQNLKGGTNGRAKDMMDVSEPLSTKSDIVEAVDHREMSQVERKKAVDSSERSLPGRWLHMDVFEKEKMEWMTDVPLYHQDSSTDRQEEEQEREVRFSLEGVVIPRNVVLPVHLGLHHHGNEPQVS